MATTVGEPIMWAEAPPDELVCAICLEVAEDPCQHGGEQGCGRVFCEACITRDQRERGQSCPTCRRQLTIFQDPKSARQIRALKVKCNNLDDGCQWVGELGELQTHLQSCDYVLVTCTNECYVNSEPCKVLKKDLSDHLANECSKRQSQCQYCNKRGVHSDIVTHLKSCTIKQVKCPNPKCGYMGGRFMIDFHRESCVYERVSCRYSELGCREMPRRKDIRKHEEEDERRFKVPLDKELELFNKVDTLERNMLTSSTTTALEEKIGSVMSRLEALLDRTAALERKTVTLQNEVAGLSTLLERGLEAQRRVTDELQSQLETQGREITSHQERRDTNITVPATPTPKYAPCTFKITSFQQHKRSGEVLHSPTFHTSPTGYKMCIGVHANGSGDGWGTHISLTVQVLRGDNDDSLTWPFNGSVIVELLNQLEDKNHHKKTISLTATRSGVEESDELFIPCSKLERGRVFRRNCQYLKNDTLFFRVSVLVAHYKPWLECTS